METKKLHWPDNVRLKMIEKSKFYDPNERIYEYGYYDGYQKSIDENQEIRTIWAELLQALIEAKQALNGIQSIYFKGGEEEAIRIETLISNAIKKATT